MYNPSEIPVASNCTVQKVVCCPSARRQSCCGVALCPPWGISREPPHKGYHCFEPQAMTHHESVDSLQHTWDFGSARMSLSKAVRNRMKARVNLALKCELTFFGACSVFLQSTARAIRVPIEPTGFFFVSSKSSRVKAKSRHRLEACTSVRSYRCKHHTSTQRLTSPKDPVTNG